jgi:hypothetical protein
MVKLLADRGHLSASDMAQRTRGKANFTGEWIDGLDKLTAGGASRCLACEKILREGDPYYHDASGENLHASCCTPTRDYFTGENGEPLAASEPIPEPLIWSED